MSNFGSVANDYPFGPRFPSTDTSVPQREQDIAKSKQLLSAAGHANGIHHHAANRGLRGDPPAGAGDQGRAAKAGININLKILNQTAYYGKDTYGNSPWLDGTMSLVDYGDRGVPNVYLQAPLTSNGPWNAARSTTRTYDDLVKQYVAALDLRRSVRSRARSRRLLLQETPIMIPYWIDGLTASTPSDVGVNPISIAQLFLGQADTPASIVEADRNMAQFILKRIGLALITLWILSVFVFLIAQVLPGDPARSILGPLAAPQAGSTLTTSSGSISRC